MTKKKYGSGADNTARYQIIDLYIVDTQPPGRGINIRELIEIGCWEFDRSEIPAKERLKIIMAVGQERVIALLQKSFEIKRRKFNEEYNAIAGIQALIKMVKKERNLFSTMNGIIGKKDAPEKVSIPVDRNSRAPKRGFSAEEWAELCKPSPNQLSDEQINRDTANYNRAMARFGIPLSQQTKDRISFALKGRPSVKATCPRCGKQGGHAAMHRWHFDRCKFNFPLMRKSLHQL